MKEKLTVLHILHELHPSGAEMMLYNAYPHWKENFDGTIMATGNKMGPFANALKERGYETVWVPTKGTKKTAKLSHLAAVYRYLRQHSYDVVHIHRESLSFEYALLARLTGSGHIVRTVHSTFAHTGIQRKIKSETRFLMRKLLRVKFVAISDGVAENEYRVFGNRCEETIYNWCNNGKFTFVSEQEKQKRKEEKGTKGKLVLVTVGNCGKVKNHELLFHAIAKMRHREKICYRHIGFVPGETEKEEKLAKELGIASLITFEGTKDPLPYLEEADIFLMTSLYEGLSIATLEAVFTGMHVLLAEVPGLVEFKDKGLENVGYFAADPDALANVLDAYVSRFEKEGLHPSAEQRKRAEQLYDCRTQAGKYAALYKKIQ